jgi:hypothetical protein
VLAQATPIEAIESGAVGQVTCFGLGEKCHIARRKKAKFY